MSDKNYSREDFFAISEAGVREVFTLLVSHLEEREKKEVYSLRETAISLYFAHLIVLAAINRREELGILAQKRSFFDMGALVFVGNGSLSRDFRIAQNLLSSDLTLSNLLGEALRLDSEMAAAIEQVDLIDIGHAYERIKSISLSTDGAPDMNKASLRRDEGVYYTPGSLARELTISTLGPLVRELNEAQKILELKILDPAVGVGVFLLEAFEYLLQAYTQISGEPHRSSKAAGAIAKSCLYGVDRDPMSVDIARHLLWIVAEDPAITPLSLEKNLKSGDSLLTLPWEAVRTLATDQTLSEDTEEIALSKAHENGVINLFPAENRGRPLLKQLIRPFSWHLSFPEIFSLDLGSQTVSGGFDVVLSNPPWGKIRPIQKEFYTQIDSAISELQGSALRDYISTLEENRETLYGGKSWSDYESHVKSYSSALRSNPFFSCQTQLEGGRRLRGDQDLYKYFVELAFRLISTTGRLGLLIPAGFNQSEGATGIRRLLLENGTIESLSVFENKKKLFPIHGMFRFQLMTFQRGRRCGISNVVFRLETIDQLKILPSSRIVSFSKKFLEKSSQGRMTIPEISTKAECRIFEKLHEGVPLLGEKLPGCWNIRFVREIDMTKYSGTFLDSQQVLKLPTNDDNLLPVYEGRMVHQFNNSAKQYVSGAGRKAVWKPSSIPAERIQPHYYIHQGELADRKIFVDSIRGGFCDISGHANERTALACLIPANAVCGNKVPTCRFDVDDPRLHLLWIAIVNSFVVDWMIRRRVSTTLNFFYWYQIPIPRIEPDSDWGAELTSLSALLTFNKSYDRKTQIWLRSLVLPSHKTSLPLSDWKRSKARARLDAIVAHLYELSIDEFKLVLSDFPLLDRWVERTKEDGLESGNDDGVTANLCLATYREFQREIDKNSAPTSLFSSASKKCSARIQVESWEMEGNAYVPSELAKT